MVIKRNASAGLERTLKKGRDDSERSGLLRTRQYSFGTRSKRGWAPTARLVARRHAAVSSMALAAS